LSEVAKSLSEQFKQQFDVLLPAFRDGWQTDWQSEPINLRLKNVTASEIFSAMNLVFENNRTPLRWELKLNGHRQIALLRVLVDPVQQVNPLAGTPTPEIKRRVYWVGNLIGDEKNGGMTMDQIIKTVTDVWSMSEPSSNGVTTSAQGVEISGGKIQFHKDAQLLVVSGTPSQVDFVEQTLKALEQKADQGAIFRARRSATEQILKDVEQKANQEKTNSRTPAR
jgi:type II secretory pathway component GspD/PulD (secretin)